ncbi:MAG: T9SS type A sorting domain-containing protein [Ignavibacteriota bacterium]
MKTGNLFWVVLLAFVCSGTLRAQQISDERYTNALNQELSKHENGAWLYQRSEIFRKMIGRTLANNLQLDHNTTGEIPETQSAIAPTFSGDISNDPFGQEEPSVAISRNNPSRIVIGANDEPADIRSMPIFLSTDAGLSWSTSRMPSPPKPYYAYSDPSLVSDQYNGFYYAFLIANETEHLSNILVAHSSDGVSWNYDGPVIADKQGDASYEDKESLALDVGNYSKTYGRLYVSWMHTEAKLSNCGLRLSWSDNQGLTWSAPKIIDSSTYGFFTQLKVDNYGKLFFTYSRFADVDSVAEHYLLVSHDNGESFIRQKIADYRNYPYSKEEGSPTLKGRKGVRAFPYIVMDYKESTKTLHVVYGSYEKWANGKSNALLYYVNSDDEGKSWREPLPIGFEGDSSALHTDRFMPWIATDALTSSIYIIYYSSQNDTTNTKLEAHRLILSKEVPITYSVLSDSLFDPLHVTDYTITPFIGDYIGCAAQGSTQVYAWTENRKGLPAQQFLDGEIFAFVNSTSTGVSELHQVSANSLGIYSVYPNPSGGNLKLGIAIPEQGSVSLTIAGAQGALKKKIFLGQMQQGTYQKECDLHDLGSGEYTITLEEGKMSSRTKIIITH